MSASAVIACVAAELEEVLHVAVPCLEIGATRSATLAALVDGHELIVVELEEGNDTLAFAVRALDVAASAANGRPRSAESPGPFRQIGILRDATLHDGFDRIIDFVEVAARKLAVECAGIKERGSARTKATAFVQIVKADDPVLAVAGFFEEEAHGDTHPEKLGCFQAAGLFACLIDDQVAIIEGLNAEEVEVHVGRWVDRIGECIEVVAEHLGRQSLNRHA